MDAPVELEDGPVRDAEGYMRVAMRYIYVATRYIRVRNGITSPILITSIALVRAAKARGVTPEECLADHECHVR